MHVYQVAWLTSAMTDTDMKIKGMNCNRLNEYFKRTAVFSELKRTDKGIYFLLENNSTSWAEVANGVDIRAINEYTFHTAVMLKYK